MGTAYSRQGAPAAKSAAGGQPVAPTSAVDDVFGQTLDFRGVLEAPNWRPPGEYYQTMPAALRQAVSSVVESDERMRVELRHEWFPSMLREGTLLLWERANPRYIEALKQKRLYAGKVAAADGTLVKYETLSLVGAQIAISRVGYQGNTGQIVSSLMHWGRELPRDTTASDVVAAIRSRGKELVDKIPNLFIFALMLYKERAILMDTPPGTFKLIQGPLFPYELLTGAGRQFVMDTCLDLLGDLIDDGAFANIVSQDTHRELEALGLALNPGEYIVTDTGTQVLNDFLRKANYTSVPVTQYGDRSQIQVFEEFRDRYGPQVVRGVLRSHAMAKPFVFYARQDRVEEAVHMLLADCSNTGPRGFPLLLDMADQYCSSGFKASEYLDTMNAEFARAASGSMRYQPERSTRDYANLAAPLK